MRWLLALSLAACSSTSSSWSWDKMTYQTRPLVIDKLHAAGGEARLVVGNRYYIVRANTLQPEIRAVLSATAAAVQAGERPPDDDANPEFWRPVGPVIAVPRLDRGLQVSDVGVERVDGFSASYRVTVRRGPEQYIATEIAATASIDQAFEALIAETRKQAVLSDGANVDGGWRFLESGFDVRGVGGAGSAEPLAEPPPAR